MASSAPSAPKSAPSAPGGLTKSASNPVLDAEAYKRKVARMQKTIDEQQAKVLDRRQSVDALRIKQKDVLNAKQTTAKLNGWRVLYDIQKRPEKGLRPPDQRFPVKLYSRMDDDVWRMSELRGWFQQYARPSGEKELHPLETKYAVYDEATLYTSKSCPPHLMFDSDQTSRAIAAGKVPHFPRTPSPHFMRDEKQRDQQHAKSQKMLATRHHYPPQVEGRMPGAGRAPWKDRPAHEEGQPYSYVPPDTLMMRDNYVAAGGGLEDYHALRHMVGQQKMAMHAGSWNGGH